MSSSSSSKPNRSRPEILAPAGDPLALRAAIAAGAGAVYLGMARFNARGRAERFRGVTLEACVRAARSHGVRVYVTLNTLLHDDELPLALELASEAFAAGANAAIVQDPGFAAMLRERLPDLPVHASTQMTIHQPGQAAALVEHLGFRRVIVARECSVEEVKGITDRIRPLGAGVEVFVHGALCFAYSGQCLMSNFAGRRSANRGICAQNCRFDFTAGPSSGASFRPRTASQLISMKDLAAFESVAALADAGVESFKIEGRLKGPEYVAEVTRLYRAALDAWEAKKPFAVEEAERAAGRVFSRGFTNGYLAARIDASMRGDKRSLEGEPDATVVSANRKTGAVTLEPRPGHSLRAGQGYRYAHDRYRGGFRVIAVNDGRQGKGGALNVKVRFGSDASGRRHRRGAAGRTKPPPPLPAGLACYLNDDPDLEKRIAKVVSAVEIRLEPELVPVRLHVSGRAGESLCAQASTPDGRVVESSSEEVLEVSRARPLDAAILEEHLGRFGGTAYRLESLDGSALAPGAFLRFPALHALRREIVEQLNARESAPKRPAPSAAHERAPPRDRRRCETSLAVCVGTPEGLRAALRAGAKRAIAECQRLIDGDARAWDEWLPLLREIDAPWIRLSPIAHDASRDQRAIEICAKISSRAGIVAGHMGQIALARCAGLPITADLYLNAYNASTLEVLQRAGAVRATLSLEVDAKEAVSVAARAPGEIEVEVIVGGAVFSMLTRQEYGLAEGERFAAVSEHGHAYRFEASRGVTTLYEARELVGAEVLPIVAEKVDAVRLDLAHQDAEAVAEIVSAYARCLEALRAGVETEAARLVELAAAAGAAHRRHAPHGHFAGHLVRGARSLDAGV